MTFKIKSAARLKATDRAGGIDPNDSFKVEVDCVAGTATPPGAKAKKPAKGPTAKPPGADSKKKKALERDMKRMKE